MFSDPRSLIGTNLDGYTLVRVLGEGGADVVFLGQLADGTRSAIKVLLPAVRTGSGKSIKDALRAEDGTGRAVALALVDRWRACPYRA
jgi:hypothetical protein